MSGQDPAGPLPYDPDAPVADQVRSSFQNSLKNLHPGETIPSVADLLSDTGKRDTGKQKEAASAAAPLKAVYVDSYLMHSPLSTLEHTIDAWREMEKLVDAGLVRQIGFSSACALRCPSHCRCVRPKDLSGALRPR